MASVPSTTQFLAGNQELHPMKQEIIVEMNYAVARPKPIPTLGNGTLFIVNRDRRYMQDKLDKRRTFLLTLALFTVVAIGIIAWILR